MFGVTSFVISGVLITLLLTLRHIEMTKGKRYFPRFRKKLDHMALIFVRYVMREFPQFIVRTSKYVILQATHLFSTGLLHVVRFLEEKLHIAVHKVRGKKNDLAKGEPTSNHLTDIQNHKAAVSKTIEELREVE